MTIKAKLGAGVWDMLVCEECALSGAGPDVDLEWTEPEPGITDECPNCQSTRMVHEERG